MATLPGLPALHVNPPAPPLDPLAEMGKVASLRNLGQQSQENQLAIQEKQMQLQDQQAMTSAMHEWDGKDLSQLPGLVLKHGGSAQAVFGLKQKTLEQQKTYSDIAKQDAETGGNKLKNIQSVNDMLLGGLKSATEGPDETLGQRLQAAAQNVLQATQGTIDPQTAQGIQQSVQQLTQLPPDQLKLHLPILEKSLQGNKAQLDAAEQAAKTSKDVAATAIDQNKLDMIQAAKANPQQFPALVDQVIPKGQYPAANIRTQALVRASLLRGDVDGAQKVITEAVGQVQGIEKETNPQVIAAKTQQAVSTAVAVEVARQKMNPAAVATVPPQLVPAATAAFAKAGEEYATANQASQNMMDFLRDAKAGNKEAIKIVPLQGALEITTAQGVHRINRTEVDQFGGAGSLYDKLAGKVGGVLTGKDITDDVLKDMAAVQQTVAQNAAQLHSNKVKTINQTYGSQFQPMKFENQAAPKSPPPQVGQQVTIKGKTMKVTAVHPDGSFDAQ